MNLKEMTKFSPMHTKLIEKPIQLGETVDDQVLQDDDIEEILDEYTSVQTPNEPDHAEDSDEFDDDDEFGTGEKPGTLHDRIVGFVEKNPGVTAKIITEHVFDNPTENQHSQVSTAVWTMSSQARTPRLQRVKVNRVFSYFTMDAVLPAGAVAVGKTKPKKSAKRSETNRKLVHESLPTPMHFDERIETVLKDYVWETGKASPQLKEFLNWYLERTGRGR